MSFPTSEAVVESWGSSNNHLNKNKSHAKEVIGLDDTGTIDKLAFIGLNGPPPGFQQNRRSFKSALQLMYEGDLTSYRENNELQRQYLALLYGLIYLLSCGNISV